MLTLLKDKNPTLAFIDAHTPSKLFKKVEGDFSTLVTYSSSIIANDENSYVSSDKNAENLECVKEGSVIFAETDIQCGWCCGGGNKMNGMEWHKSSEVVVACTDMALLLGDFFDIEHDIYNSEKAICLYLAKGEAVELLPLTLHLAPLRVNEFFKAAIVLPKGTNEALEGGTIGTLRAKNKWLLVHKENIKGISLGGKIGICGENIAINI